MVSQARENRLWLGAMLVVLCVCMATVPVAVLPRSGWVSETARTHLNSFTMGAVACPYSAIVGWNVGRGWRAVPNVVPCSQGDSPAAWILLRWPNGKRTSICVDFDTRKC